MAELNNLGGDILSKFSSKFIFYIIYSIYIYFSGALIRNSFLISLFEMVQPVYMENLIMSVYTHHKTSCACELVF